MGPSISGALQDQRGIQLTMAIRNFFAQGSDEEIAMVVEAIHQDSPAGATAAIISMVGPQKDRAAMVLPAMYAPGTLADPAVVARIVTAGATFKAGAAPTLVEARNALRIIPRGPDVQGVLEDTEQIVPTSLGWGALGGLIARIAFALISKRFLPYWATPSLVTNVGRVVGGIFGTERGIAELGHPMGTGHQGGGFPRLPSDR